MRDRVLLGAAGLLAPVYPAGIIYLRTAVWFVSIVGIAMIVIEAW